jgi:imidazolonepropionase-like amidohydrolase
MGRASDLGSVSAGKLADLLILEQNPLEDIRAMRSVRQVIRGGVVRDVEEFRAPTPTNENEEENERE